MNALCSGVATAWALAARVLLGLMALVIFASWWNASLPALSLLSLNSVEAYLLIYKLVG